MAFKRTHPCKALYYLMHGSIDLLDAKYEVLQRHAHTPEACLPLDNHETHQYSAVCISDCYLVKVDKEVLDQALTWSQTSRFIIDDIHLNPENAATDWSSALLSRPIFQKLPPHHTYNVLQKFEPIDYETGETIIHEGDFGDAFYVVKTGFVYVTRKTARGTNLVATLGPTQQFGEDALIGSTLRNASVTMKTAGVVLRLWKKDFKELLEVPTTQYMSHQEYEQFKRENSNVELLDVRLPIEIPKSEHNNRLIVPLPYLRQRLDELDRRKRYILCADGGRRATLGAYLLNQSGYSATILKD